MSNDRRNRTASQASWTPNLHDFIGLARTVFGASTGLSPNISAAQQSLHGDLTQVPLDRASVDRLVNAENFMAMNGPHNTPQDRVAYAFTPLRRAVAHSVARTIVVNHFGIDSDHEYAREERVYRDFQNHHW